MLLLALKNLIRRPARTLLTLSGLAISTALLACLLSFGQGYEQSLHVELDRMGMQMMLVPLGCPYDAAARVLKGRALDVSMPERALAAARADPAVAIAAPMYAAAIPRLSEGRTDLWVGIDRTTLLLKPWWKLTPGSHWLEGPDSVLLGSDAAEAEMRNPGDLLYSPETRRSLRVCGVLKRTGTSDDSLFFVKLSTAQSMFHHPGRLTAVDIRLKDPTLLSDAAARLQQTPGAQVVTLTEMMGTFLNMVGAARSLTLAIALVALAIGALSVFNTMMASVLERTREMGVLRALGISRLGVLRLMTAEALLLSAAGGLLGTALALVGGAWVERAVVPFLPLAPRTGLPSLTAAAFLDCASLISLVGLAAGLYPAIQASRMRPAEALRLE
ncbi:MAG TPA: ABC transporter permease [Armatimonadota bacterium]|nr:ABC transporter permease [Armatimonadota bacterium]